MSEKQEIDLETTDLSEALLKATLKMYEETGDDIHLKAHQDLKDGLRKPFECANGRVYLLPKNHCGFCKHCYDILYDYTNGPYMFFCDLECEGGHETCGKFEEE